MSSEHMRLYVDESYQQDHYYVAGVLVTPDQERHLISSLDSLARNIQHRFQWPTTPEFHAHALMQGQDEWEPLKRSFKARFLTYTNALRVIASNTTGIHIEGVDIRRLNSRYRYPQPPHQVAFQHLLEQVNERCSIMGHTYSVIADTVPEQEDYHAAIRLHAAGRTPSPHSQPLTCFSGAIEFVDSRTSRGVQAADMCAYLYRKWRESENLSPDTRRAVNRLHKIIAPVLTGRKWLP